MKFLEIVRTGLGVTIQDLGRPGWKRFGVPASGVMDPHAARWANRLLGNADNAPVLELLLQGTEFRMLSNARVAVTGADACDSVQSWTARIARKNEALTFSNPTSGLWTYVAVEGGFEAEQVMGSASMYPRGGIGGHLKAGDVLSACDLEFPSGLDSGWVYWAERREYNSPPLIRVWPGPQWDKFDDMERAGFFHADWEVSSRSDRVGYRLEGARMNPPAGVMRSEPVVIGSIQVPPNGQPIVTMRDGPTVGGYPKIGVVDPESLPWLAQCRPGVKFRMALVE